MGTTEAHLFGRISLFQHYAHAYGGAHKKHNRSILIKKHRMCACKHVHSRRGSEALFVATVSPLSESERKKWPARIWWPLKNISFFIDNDLSDARPNNDVQCIHRMINCKLIAHNDDHIMLIKWQVHDDRKQRQKNNFIFYWINATIIIDTTQTEPRNRCTCNSFIVFIAAVYFSLFACAWARFLSISPVYGRVRLNILLPIMFAAIYKHAIQLQQCITNFSIYTRQSTNVL